MSLTLINSPQLRLSIKNIYNKNDLIVYYICEQINRSNVNMSRARVWICGCLMLKLTCFSLTRMGPNTTNWIILAININEQQKVLTKT